MCWNLISYTWLVKYFFITSLSEIRFPFAFLLFVLMCYVYISISQMEHIYLVTFLSYHKFKTQHI